jgi:hypothetical protein
MLQHKAHAPTNDFRAVTGGAYRIRGAYGLIAYGSVFPKVGTIPLSTPAPGTIISQGVNVRGTNTTFKSDLREGYFLHAKGVVRKILHVTSDTLLVLESGFPTDITSAGEGVRFIRPQGFNTIYAKSTGSANPTLQEATFVQNDTSFQGGSPISYDASAANAEISFEVTE